MDWLKKNALAVYAGLNLVAFLAFLVVAPPLAVVLAVVSAVVAYRSRQSRTKDGFRATL